MGGRLAMKIHIHDIKNQSHFSDHLCELHFYMRYDAGCSPPCTQRAVQEVPAGNQRGDPTRRLVLWTTDAVPAGKRIISQKIELIYSAYQSADLYCRVSDPEIKTKK